MLLLARGQWMILELFAMIHAASASRLAWQTMGSVTAARLPNFGNSTAGDHVSRWEVVGLGGCSRGVLGRGTVPEAG